MIGVGLRARGSREFFFSASCKIYMNVLVLSLSASSVAFRASAPRCSRPRVARPPACFEAIAKTSQPHGPPSETDSAALATASPAPALQPREVVATMLHALHRSNRGTGGYEAALRFISPTHQYRADFERSGKYSAASFARYLRQPHKASLLGWDEYRWDGDTTLIQGEAYQQTSVRASVDATWTSVRWLLTSKEVEGSGASQWMVEAVFVDEPDDAELAAVEPLAPLEEPERRQIFAQLDTDESGAISPESFVGVVASLGFPREQAEALAAATDTDGDGAITFGEFSALLSKVNQQASAAGSFARLVTDGVRATADAAQSPQDVVTKVLRALRDEPPYPLYGAEVAIRYCSPTNPAAQLTPATFATYLDEPHYAILTQWDEVEEEEEEGGGGDWVGSTAEQTVLVRRSGEESWTLIEFMLSRHNGRWLIDSLNIV